MTGLPWLVASQQFPVTGLPWLVASQQFTVTGLPWLVASQQFTVTGLPWLVASQHVAAPPPPHPLALFPCMHPSLSSEIAMPYFPRSSISHRSHVIFSPAWFALQATSTFILNLVSTTRRLVTLTYSRTLITSSLAVSSINWQVFLSEFGHLCRSVHNEYTTTQYLYWVCNTMHPSNAMDTFTIALA